MLDEDAIYLDKLRAQSLRPGGFGNERTCVWCAKLQLSGPDVLLNCHMLTGLPYSVSVFHQSPLHIRRFLQYPLQMIYHILMSVRYVWIQTGAL